MKYIFLLLTFCAPLFSSAQLSGEIIYEDKMNLHKRIPEERAEMKKMIPEFRTEQMILLFNSEEAVYHKYDDPNKEVEEDIDMSQKGRKFHFRNMRSSHILYQNYQEDKRIEQREFFDKKFLITGEPHLYTWKLEGDTKDVGDYTAVKASYSDSTRNIIAWFVPEIAVPLGPGEFGQLPGLILHIDINDGERIITAQNISLRKIEKDEIVMPTKGKKMTQDEFRKMTKEKMKEMGHGAGGIRTIRRRG